MYSVEDLLISHGYKLSRSLPAPQQREHEGHRPEGTRPSAGHGALNGYDKDPGAPRRGRTSDAGGGGHRSTPRSPREPQPPAAALRTSDVGFYHQPPSAWTSQLQAGTDPSDWRRRGPEHRGLPDRRDREDPDVRGLTQAHSRPVYLSEGPWDVGARTENVSKKAMWEEEPRMPAVAKWHPVSLESRLQPGKLGRQTSGGGREKLFQDPYPPAPGENGLNPQHKGKSQSLPKVLSPESLSYVEMPVLLNDGHWPGAPKRPLCPPNRAPSSESTRAAEKEKGGSTVPPPQPKFGRPLKPPSYEVHQQARGGVDGSQHQEGQPADDLHAPRPVNAGHARQEHGGSDSSLEPPVYVPPPSYHSPSPHITNPYLEDAAPRHGAGDRGQPPPPVRKTAGDPDSSREYSASPRSPRRPAQHPTPRSAHGGSVQYIPFDDPRIRHIPLTQPQDLCEESAPRRPHGALPAAAPEPVGRQARPSGAAVSVPSSESDPAVLGPGPPCPLGWPSRDGDPGAGAGAAAGRRDGHAGRGRGTDPEGAQGPPPGGPAPSPKLQGGSTCEAITRLKKFETGLQSKKSSKKQQSETVFCLVSIPVRPEPRLPGAARSGSDRPRPPADRASPEQQGQRLLSMSAADLELQALTSHMAGRTEPQTQGPSCAAEARQASDLRSSHATRGHRELKYSDSWPGLQLRGHQTQAALTEEPKGPQPLPSEKPGGLGHTVLTPSHIDPSTSGTLMPVASAPGDPGHWPSGHHLKGQVYLGSSSDSAFSRTPATPTACLGQPPLGTQGPRAHPAPHDEVPKGRPTSPCHSQQLFGQFLLKPVNRRPWDLISQLENFNRELQEQKESSGGSSSGSSSDGGVSSSEESGAEGPEVVGMGSRGRVSTGYSRAASNQQQQLQRQGRQPPRVPGAEERESEDGEEQRARPLSPGVPPAEGSRGRPFRPAGGSWVPEKRSQEGVGTRESQRAASPGPAAGKMAFRLGDPKPALPLSPAGARVPRGSPVWAGAAHAVKAPEAEGREASETETAAAAAAWPLSVVSKPWGLSAPDLRSPGQEQSSSSRSGEWAEHIGALDIPENESLQERAERILGIEVAVESLLRASRRAAPARLCPEEAGPSAFRPPSPKEEAQPGSAPAGGGPAAAVSAAACRDAFYGRRKCGWAESPLFVGERGGATRTARESAPSGGDAALSAGPETRPQSPEPQDLGQKDTESGAPSAFRSTLFHFVERSPGGAGSEKRCRSTSRVIETLQEKLASPPRRADPDRLLRMREVSSVSRMRLLSSRSSDSAEEAEDPKAERAQGAQPRGSAFLNGGDPPRRAASTARALVSLEDSRHLTARSARKKGGQDFWCPDSYDPSRVERV